MFIESNIVIDGLVMAGQCTKMGRLCASLLKAVLGFSMETLCKQINIFCPP